MQLPDYLKSDPFGDILFTGHRVPLHTVLRLEREGATAVQIAEELPTLSGDLIEKVLAFCQENRAEIDAYFERMQSEIERQAAREPISAVQRIRRTLQSPPAPQS
jgi:uncharacterized protein (DUF433 family)